MQIGIVGGTGAAGCSLSVRLSSLGHEIMVGSRDPSKAVAAVAKLIGDDQSTGQIRGVPNVIAAKSDLVFLATPWEGAPAAALALREELAGKTVVSIVNALFKYGREFQPLTLARGSAAQTIQSVIPDSYVVSALHHVPAHALADVSRPVECDVLVCSDHVESKEQVITLLDSIPGIVGLDAGSLANSGAVEGMTAVLINLNVRYRTRTALRITGISRG